MLVNAYGGLWGAETVFRQATISTWGIQDGSTNPATIKEAIWLYSPNATTIYIGINNTTPAHTPDIINVAIEVTALNIKNAAATSTIFLSQMSVILVLVGH